jgi:predicted Fe-Mo cluster-binding NifX family protein
VTAASAGTGSSAGNRRTAVPVFLGRVSPVLDTCTQLLLLDSGGNTKTSRKTIPMKGSSLFDRAREIQGFGISVIICGAVGDSFYNLLREAGIDLVCGITGDIDEVIEAYRNGMLEQPRFRMPGSY